MFKYRDKPTTDPLRGIAGRQGALTWYRKTCTHDFGGYPVTVTDLTGVLCLLATHDNSETGFGARFVFSPRLGMKSDSDGLWSLVVAN